MKLSRESKATIYGISTTVLAAGAVIWAYTWNSPSTTGETTRAISAASIQSARTNQAVSKRVVVTMGNMAFEPQSIQVTPGTTVVWKNTDMISHTVTSGPNRTGDGRFNSQNLSPGQTFSYTFTKPGQYPYFCVYHPGMNADVTVSGSTTGKTGASTTGSMTSMTPSASKPNYPIAPLGTGTSGEPVGADGIHVLPYTVQNGVKVFHMTLRPVHWAVQKGRVVEAWAFNGSVPGPEIKVNQGDKVKILVTNDLPEGTSVHWHGLDVPYGEDGVGGLSQPDIQPGKTFTYQFTINQNDPPGTYMYHSHPMMDMMKQETMGTFGPFIVEPKGTPHDAVHPGYQKEYTLMLDDSSQFGYTINGKSYPDTSVLPAKVGDNILIHLMNVGDMDHPMHLHGFHFRQIEQDGYPLPAPIWLDTIDTTPGSTYDLALKVTKPGLWLFHCHILDHVTSGQQMSGMITLFDVKN